MKKIALIAVMAFALTALTVTNAQAKDMSQRFGVGADSSLGWGTAGLPAASGGESLSSTGLSVIYNISKAFGLQMILGAGFATASDDAADYSANNFGVSVRGIIPVAFTNDVNLGAVVGFSFQSMSSTVSSGGGDVDASASFISFDLGIRPEWFVTEHFSVHTQVGVAVSLLGENDFAMPFADGTGGSGTAFDLFQNADLLGNAGFTFWF